jgi:hypothetical protein
MEFAIVLYLIGVMWFSQTIYHEDGKTGIIMLLSLVWPLFVIYATIFGIEQDED